MNSAGSPSNSEPAFGERAGAAWVAAQDQTDAQLDPFGRAAMAKLALPAGARVLDIGCGCGQTLLELAEIVGPSGRVVGIDISEPMLARARERVGALPAVELFLGDAQTYPLAAADFDAAFSRFGVMFFEDATRAFANIRRALRPDGRLSFVCWQELARNPWADLPLRAVLKVLGRDTLPDLLQPDRPGPYYFADTERVRGVLSTAGFADVQVEPFERPLQLGGAMTLDQAVQYGRQIGPAARAMADAPAALQPALDAAVAGALAPFASARGVWLDAAAFIVTARASG